MTKKISRALLSVSDKSGIIELAQSLSAAGVTILSTGGTASALADNGIDVIGVSDVTGFPEIMDGRVKTLHPKIHGAILGRREVDASVMQQHDITGIDLVVVNLYPFQQTIARPDCTFDEAIENIDIGGPAMIRAAAKNHNDVTVVTDPEDYGLLASAISDAGGLSAQQRETLACKAFSHTASYDSAVARYLQNRQEPADEAASDYPSSKNIELEKIQELRYGENPHQTAAFYRQADKPPSQNIVSAQQLQGKELSFNNIADSDAALECVLQFSDPACVIVKHANPCGVSVAANISNAYEHAYKTDPVSAFGGIIAFNRELDASTAKTIVDRQFVEVLLAPSIHPDALEVVKSKPNVRLLQLGSNTDNATRYDYRRVNGGFLIQESDAKMVTEDELQVVTETTPNAAQIADLLFAWKVVKFVKSNAIVFCRDNATIGIGAGQMSRVYSAKIASIKADDAELKVASSVMASDAFFPFRDTVDQAAGYGVKAIIQPGGSMRDDEAIAAANEHGIAMVFTGVRHFRH